MAYIPMFYGSANPLNVFVILPNYDITRKSNKAAQDGCRSEYYSNSVHSYPREILLVSIPRLSRLLSTLEQLVLRSDGYVIVKFKVNGVEVLSTSPNCIFYKSLFLNTPFQALTV